MVKLLFNGSFQAIRELPVSDAEVCFVGRSNVGKSTVVNAVCGQKVAITSKTPGRTMGLNFFKVENTSSFIVDVPGYGFAKVGKNLLEKWHVLLPEYLKRRMQLKKVYLIIDSKIGFTRSDKEVLGILKDAGVTIFFIFNKIDKTSPERLKALSDFVGGTTKDEFCFLCAKKPATDVIKKLRMNVGDALGVSSFK